MADVLHPLFALIDKVRADLAPHGPVHCIGHGDAARFGHPFETRRNVHPVAVHRAVRLLDQVAHVNADPKAHLPIVRHRVGGHPQLVLNGNGGCHRPGRRLEYGKHRVAGRVDHPAMVRLDLRTKYRSRRIERDHGRAVVDRHQARIARHIRREDRRQALLEISSVQNRRAFAS